MASSNRRYHLLKEYGLHGLIVVMFLLAIVWGFFVYLPSTDAVPQIPFEAEGWKAATPIDSGRTVRSQMIKDLKSRFRFDGWTKQQVVDLLGPPDRHPSRSSADLHYYLGVDRGGAFYYRYIFFELDERNRVVRWGTLVD